MPDTDVALAGWAQSNRAEHFLAAHRKPAGVVSESALWPTVSCRAYTCLQGGDRGSGPPPEYRSDRCR